MASTELQEGLVVKTQSGFYSVQTDEKRVVCQLRGTLKQASKKTELCVIGDRVRIEILPDSTGVIHQILPRDRVLSRVEPSDYAGTSTEREQIIIANVEQVVYVYAAAAPAPNPRLLDRFLVAAEKAGIPSIALIVNKVDLVGIDAARATFGMYERIGYDVHYVSAHHLTDDTLDSLRQLLAGRISVFTGPSGVGKSSLLNAIQPGLGRAVGSISHRTTKGKHTTVHAELFPVDGGGYVGDTPGLRTLAPWDVEPDELDGYFREFGPYVAECQFSDCTHLQEPGCAVRAALDEGRIEESRYDSYTRLRQELTAQYVY